MRRHEVIAHPRWTVALFVFKSGRRQPGSIRTII